MTSHWDPVLRLPLVIYYGTQAGASALTELRDGLSMDWLNTYLPMLADFLSRVTITLFMLAIVVSVILRFRAVSTAEGVYPRLVAFLGTFILLATTTLPRTALSPGLQFAASALTLLGFSLSGVVMIWLGRSFSVVPEARRLVLRGPYRLVRHPLYVTEEIAAIGLFLHFASLQAVPLFALHAVMQYKRMQLEERVLQSAFPDYGAYAARTARLIPGLY